MTSRIPSHVGLLNEWDVWKDNLVLFFSGGGGAGHIQPFPQLSRPEKFSFSHSLSPLSHQLFSSDTLAATGHTLYPV